MYSIYDVFGAVTLTIIIVTLTIGLFWSIATNERLRNELKKEKEND